MGKHDNAAPDFDAAGVVESVDQQRNRGNESSEPALPRMLTERYRLDALIARGGMGKVYLATQLPLERRVALKLLVTPTMNEDFRRRFFLEASVLARLSHPNIVVVHDYGEAPDGSLFMVMEYLDGVTLLQTLRKDGRLPLFRALQITAEICRAVRASHRKGIAHRDLKPGNVILLPNKEEEARDLVKVLDFGLVKVFQEQQEIDLERDLTRSELMLGSPRYMAPEQIQCENVDARADIYSLGVVLFSMLVGRPPFVGTTLEILNQHLEAAPPGINETTQQVGGFSVLEPEVCTVLDAIIRRCMRKAPAERYQSMDELLVDLREAYGLISDDSLDPQSTLEIMRPGASTPPPLSMGSPPPPLTVGNTPPPLPSARARLEEGNTTKRAKPLTPVPAPLAPIEPTPSRRKLIVALLAALAVILSIGLVVTFLFFAPQGVPQEEWLPPPTDLAVIDPPPNPISSSPEQVTIQLSSEPIGAEVSRNDEVLGRTPLDVTISPGPAGEVLEYVFRLDGYEEVAVRTAVEGDSARVHADLVPNPSPGAVQPNVAPRPALPAVDPVAGSEPQVPVGARERPAVGQELQPGAGERPAAPAAPATPTGAGERPRPGANEQPAAGTPAVDGHGGTGLTVDDTPRSIPIVD